MKLKNKICVITGGAAGIGKKISQCFLQEGALVYIFDVNQDHGNTTVTELSSVYGKEKVFYKNVNVTDEFQVEKTIDEIIARHLSIDVLVNNAGITRDNLIMRMSLEDWKKVIDINLTGSFICSKSVIRHMI